MIQVKKASTRASVAERVSFLHRNELEHEWTQMFFCIS